MSTNTIDRRRILQGMAIAGAGFALGSSERELLAQATPVVPTDTPAAPPLATSTTMAAGESSPATAEISDDDIFNFVLNLEYLEAEYYLLGTTGAGVGAEDLGANPGTVTGGAQVPFQTDSLRQFLEEVAQNELAHVRYYRQLLGEEAVDRPAIDLTGGFAAVATGANLGTGFDPFADEIGFLLGGMLFEDVGVTGYHGLTSLILSSGGGKYAGTSEGAEYVGILSGVLGVEAYHMGMARSQLYQAGSAAIAAANAITVARGQLNGMPGIEQGIEVDGHANFVPSDENGVVFSRTPQQVLQIAYVTPDTGVTSGGFFPNGVNGTIVST